MEARTRGIIKNCAKDGYAERNKTTSEEKEQPTHGYTERSIGEFQTAPAIIGRIVIADRRGNTLLPSSPGTAKREMTGAMDGSKLREINGRLDYLRRLDKRRRRYRVHHRSRAR